MLRDADGQEPLRVKLDAVHVDQEGVVDRRLHLDAVENEAGLSGTIRPVNVDVAATGEQCPELEDLTCLLPPPFAQLLLESSDKRFVALFRLLALLFLILSLLLLLPLPLFLLPSLPFLWVLALTFACHLLIACSKLIKSHVCMSAVVLALGWPLPSRDTDGRLVHGFVDWWQLTACCHRHCLVERECLLCKSLHLLHLS